MNRDQPPKRVYANNRLKKASLVTNNQINRQPHQSVTSDNLLNNFKDAEDKPLHFSNKNQSKYQKHFEPHPSPTYLDLKKSETNQGIQPLVNKPSRQGALGVPLHHTYVQRNKISSTYEQEPVCKKFKITATADESLGQPSGLQKVKCQGYDNMQWIGQPCSSSKPGFYHIDFPEQSLQENSCEENKEENFVAFFHGVTRSLQIAFDEISRDCPEIATSAKSEKDGMLKILRACTQKYREIQKKIAAERLSIVSNQQVYEQRNCHTPHNPTLLTLRTQDLNRHAGGAMQENSTGFNSHLTRYMTPSLNSIPTNNTTKLNSSLNISHRFKNVSSTPREFLPRHNSEFVNTVRSGMQSGKFELNPNKSGPSSNLMQPSSKGSFLMVDNIGENKEFRDPESESKKPVSLSGRLPLFDDNRLQYLSRYSNRPSSHVHQEL